MTQDVQIISKVKLLH